MSGEERLPEERWKRVGVSVVKPDRPDYLRAAHISIAQWNLKCVKSRIQLATNISNQVEALQI